METWNKIKFVTGKIFLYVSIFVVWAFVSLCAYWLFVDRVPPVVASLSVNQPPSVTNEGKNLNILYEIHRKRYCDFELNRYIVSVKNKHVKIRIQGIGKQVWDDEPLRDYWQLDLSIPGGLPEGIYYYYNELRYMCNPIQHIVHPIVVHYPKVFFIIGGPNGAAQLNLLPDDVYVSD